VAVDWAAWGKARATSGWAGDGTDCHRFWADVGLLVWWVKSGPQHEPLLIARTTPPSPPLLGLDDIGFGGFAGARVAAGWWLGDGPPSLGVEVAGLVLGKVTRHERAFSDPAGSPELYRPVLDGVTGQPATVDVSFPRHFSGRLDVLASSQLWGAEANARWVYGALGCCRAELLGGFRHLGLEEGLDIVQLSQGLGGPLVTGAFGTLTGMPRIRVEDNFRCLNLFYGPQAGFRCTLPWDPCWLALTGKFAAGVTDQLLRISGSTSFTQGGDGVSFVAGGGRVPLGLLAGPGNIGSHSRTHFGCVAEGGLEWGVQPCSWLAFSMGYTFLWWDGVLRPGDQIDRRVNLATVPLSPTFGAPGGPLLPNVNFRERDFWAQGLTLALRFLF
jgi:hypothetical protein